MEPRVRYCGARVSADKRVRRTGRQPQIPGNQIPGHGPYQPSEHDPFIYLIRIDQSAGNGLGYGVCGQKECDEIEESRHNYRAYRGEHAGGNNGGYGVGRVMESVGEIKNQSDNYSYRDNHKG